MKKILMITLSLSIVAITSKSEIAEAGLFRWGAEYMAGREVKKQAAKEAAERQAARAYSERTARREASERAAIRQEQQLIRDAAERTAIRKAREKARVAAVARNATIGKYGRSITVGAMTLGTGALMSTIAHAGYKPNPVGTEQQAVFKEMATILSQSREARLETSIPPKVVYKTKTCTHPETRERYLVPSWSKFCSDGRRPQIGKTLNLGNIKT